LRDIYGFGKIKKDFGGFVGVGWIPEDLWD